MIGAANSISINEIRNMGKNLLFNAEKLIIKEVLMKVSMKIVTGPKNIKSNIEQLILGEVLTKVPIKRVTSSN